MTRQEEFENAVKVIHKLLQEKLVVAEEYGKQKEVDQVMIRTGYRENIAVATYWYNSSNSHMDDKESGMYVNEHARLKVIDPADVARKELEAAKILHAKALKDAAQATEQFTKSQAKVRELEDQIVKLGGVK